VMETVGEPTWDHSLKSLTQGGVVVVTGATGGNKVVTDLRRIFFLQQRIVGSTMGTRDELVRLMRLMVERDVRPVVDSTAPLEDAAAAFRKLAEGDVFGKIVLTRPA
jgi:D-arabinose 1-dehydrogenase-like Zn-dependent alcohol dehydrogenase